MIQDKKARAPFVCLSLLSMFLVGCLFMGAPLVNAQSDEYTELSERIARMEGILEQMNERLLELNHLGNKIDALNSEINGRIDGLHSTITSGNRNLLITIVSVVILLPFSISVSKRYIERKD